MKKNILLHLKKILYSFGDNYHLIKVYLNYLCRNCVRINRVNSFLIIFSSFTFVLFNSNFAYSQITVDGNPSDWPSVLNNSVNTKKAFKHDPFNAIGTDDQWTQGSKDTDSSPATYWKWVYGNSNDKGDIGNAGAVLLGTQLYFFGDRAAFNGDAQIGFWFFLDDVMPIGSGASASSFTGEHSNGDLLIISNFTNGGGNVQPTVYIWMGKTANSPGALVQINANTVSASLASNSSVYNVPGGVSGTVMFNGDVWSFSPKSGAANTYPVPLFFEGSVDLGTIPGVNPCFKRFLLETRNSQSLTASLQDLVAGGFSGVPPAPTVVANSRCGTGSLTLSASECLGTLNWYASASGGLSLSTGSSYVTPSISQTTTYYVSCTVGGCEGARTPVVATINPPPTASAVSTEILCNGGNSTITVSGTGGTAPYTYALEAGAYQAGNTFVVTAGSYTVYVKDAKGCIDDAQVTISQPNPDQPDISIENGSGAYCGLTSAEAQPVLNDDFNQWLNTFEVLDPGTEGVGYPIITRIPADPSPPSYLGGEVTVSWTITDACGKSETISKIFAVNGCNILCELLSQPTPCNVAGKISAKAQAGFPPYTFKLFLTASGPTFIDPPLDIINNVLDNTFVDFLNLSPGNYTVLMLDANQDSNLSATACSIDVTRNTPLTVTTHCSNHQFNACGKTQDALNTDYATWFASLAPSEGTNLDFSISVVDAQGSVVDIDGVFAPNKCGGIYTATVTYSDDCGQSGSCQAIYTVNENEAVDVTGPENLSFSSCDFADQTAVETAFTNWINSFQTLNDGCNAVADFSGDPRVAPSLCAGGTVNVTYSISDNCSSDSVSASFTIIREVAVDVTGPKNLSLSSCDFANQDALNAAFTTWLGQFQTLNDGCNAVADFSGDPRVAPSICAGGIVNVTYSISDNCSSDSVSASFIISAPIGLIVTGPDDYNQSTCATESQLELDQIFDFWLSQFSYNESGTCYVTEEIIYDHEPNYCGDNLVVTYKVSDRCGQIKEIVRNFIIQPTPPIEFDPIDDFVADSCDFANQDEVQLAFDAWISGFYAFGGCNVSTSFQDYVVPSYCGGEVTVTFIASDRCNSSTSLSAKFKINEASPIVISSPDNLIVDSCDFSSQDEFENSVNAWLLGFTTSGSCYVTTSFESYVLPDYCGGKVRITFNASDRCGNNATSYADVIVNAPSDIVVYTPQDYTINSCGVIDVKELEQLYQQWIDSFNHTGGCQVAVDIDNPGIPSLCGGSSIVTYTVSGPCNQYETASASFTITASEQLTISCPPSYDGVCEGQTQVSFATWISQFGYSGGCNPTATDLSQFIMPNPGETLTINFEVYDSCSSLDCSSSYTTPLCNEPVCTYTQGFYGNYMGMGCMPEFGLTKSQEMMVHAINNFGGIYNFGSTITGNYFRLVLSDINGNPVISKNNIYKMLPGGGTPRALVGDATYSNYSTWADNNPLNAGGSKKGKINNVLLAQTMTLFFNLQNDVSLSDVKLKPNFATVDVVSCGSNIPVPETIQLFSIDNALIQYLINTEGSATVGDLFKLANKALGGENIAPLNYSMINNAVDNINKGFDECRIETGVPDVQYVAESNSIKENVFTLYPIPFNSYFIVKVNEEINSDLTIQIFDPTGRNITSITDKQVYLNKEIYVEIPNTNYHSGTLYFVRLTTKDGSVVKNILSAR